MLRTQLQRNRQYNSALANQKRQNDRVKQITQDIKVLTQKVSKLQQSPSNKKYLPMGSYNPNFTQLQVRNFINPNIRDSSVVRVVGDKYTVIS